MTTDRFVHDTLSLVGQKMITRQGQEIAAKLKMHSGHLSHDRHLSVSSNRLTLMHPDYERFLDMRRNGGRKHRRARIHNRFVYGAYASIADRLMNGYSSDILESFKGK